MKKLLSILFIVLFSFNAFSCASSDNNNQNKDKESTQTSQNTNTPNFEDDNSMFVYPTDPATYVVDYIRSMATLEWTPKDTVYLFGNYQAWSYHLTYNAGEKYYGPPFLVGSKGTMQQFENSLDNGVYVGGTTNADCIGDACYDAVYAALIQVCPSITFESTEDMLPANNTGLIPVGMWKDTASKHDTSAVVKSNAIGIMAKAYAQLKAGDVVLKHIVSQDAGHTRILSKDATVIYDANGNIDADKSYITTIEQTNAWDKNTTKKTTWWVDKTYTFNELYSTRMVPLRPVDYTRELEAPYIKSENILKDNDITKSKKLNGTLSSNHYIIEVCVEITDENGKAINTQSFFPTAKDVWLEDLKYNQPFNELSNGKYTLTIKASLAFGTKTIAVIDFDI